eukprot:EG_transcript_9165
MLRTFSLLIVVLLCCSAGQTKLTPPPTCDVAIWREPNASMFDSRWDAVCRLGNLRCCTMLCPSVKCCLANLPVTSRPKVVIVQLAFYLSVDSTRRSLFVGVRELYTFEMAHRDHSGVRLPVFLLDVVGNLFCLFPLKWWPVPRTLAVAYDYRLPAPSCYVGPKVRIRNVTILPLPQRPYLLNFVSSLDTNAVRPIVHAALTKFVRQHPQFKDRIVIQTRRTPPAEFVRLLTHSVFTVAVEGKRPDTHRFWEALDAGSIPVIARYPHTKVPSLQYAPSCRAHAPPLLAPNVSHVVLNSWSSLPYFLASNLSAWVSDHQSAARRQAAAMASKPRLLAGCITESLAYIQRWLTAADHWGRSNVTRPAPPKLQWYMGKWLPRRM